MERKKPPIIPEEPVEVDSDEDLRRWSSLIGSSDLGGLHRVLTGLDHDSIEMREVSPMSGLLAEHERISALVR